MKKTIYLSFLSMLLSLVALSQDSLQKTISEIEALVNKYGNENDVPSINMGIIVDGRTHFINYGLKNRLSTEKTNENSIFQIGSVSKLLTGIIINDLALENKIDINESILRYLPSSYSKKTKSKLEDITIEDLIHHRSGIVHQSKIIKRKDGDPIIYDYRETDFEKDFEKMKIKSKESFDYSNFGYSLLGYIAERTTDKTYDELIENTSKEYGMHSTSIYCENSNLLVTAYRKDNRKIETENWKMGKLAPSGGLYSSVFDLTNLLLAQLKVYKKANKEDRLFLTANKRAAWSGTGISYGYGLFDWGNGDFGHGGDMDGYGSDYWFNPKEDVGFVLLTSSGGKWVLELSKKISLILIDKKKINTTSNQEAN